MPDDKKSDAELLESSMGLDFDQLDDKQERSLALIIDDDYTTINMLKLILQRAGINVIGAFSGKDALEKCADTSPDIILLDLMMPEMDGWEVYQHLRVMTNAPVIIISAVHLEDSVVKAFDLGVEDYITKPFAPKEVIARVQSVLRKVSEHEKITMRTFPHLNISVNMETRQVFLEKETVNLTQTEFAVFEKLVMETPNPVTYEAIGEHVWEEYSPEVRKRLKWAIHLLRRKLEKDPAKPELIVTHTKLGYQLKT
ncbi:MAG: response regulator transcription factor [Chloroflexi bacterium]|nr:response regulator transcription factor [Chloroflexota bacterium]